MDAAGERGAVDWLVSAAAEPETCRREWESHPLGVALLPAGRVWDVVVARGRLARAAAELLIRRTPRPGPVLADFGDARVGFLVPVGTASRWLGTGIRTLGAGSWLVVPYPGRATGGVRWLVEPDGSGVLNDPALLEEALHGAAADLDGGRSRPWESPPLDG